MKFTVIVKGTYSVEWPQIQLIVNGQVCGEAEIQEHTEVDFDIEFNESCNQIEIAWTNKQQHHTVFEHGRIIQDQTLELCQVRLDDILLDNWFLTQGYYYPDYFEGFLQQVPDAPRQLASQLIWHFPGRFQFEPVPNQQQFWFWYRDQRRYVHIKTHNNKSQYREEQYIGSFDPLTDLVQGIERIINA